MSMHFRFGLTGMVLALAACSGGSSSNTTNPVPDLGDPTSKVTPKDRLEQTRFASCQAFKDYYSEALAQEFFTGYTYYRDCFGCEPALFQEDVAFSDAEGAPTAAPNSGERRVSDTNTQEAGVDEPDLIETNPNGTEIYVLRRFERELLVIDTADTANPQILARVSLGNDGRQPRGMFFDPARQRLSVILEQAIYYFAAAPAVTDAAIAPPPDFQQGTEVLMFDVSQPSSPRQIGRYLNDGHFVDARAIGDRLHLVTQFGFPYPDALASDEDFHDLAYRQYPRALESGDDAEIARLEAEIRQRIDSAVNATAIAALLPAQQLNNAAEQTLACADIYRPDVSQRLGLLMISSLDNNASALSTIGTINNAWQVYASADNLYLLQTSGGWWFDRAQKQQTAIQRVAIGNGAPQPQAVGLIDGWINDSYQLSEHNGHLRAVATEGRFVASGERFRQLNHLSILGASNLNEVSSLKNFLPNKPRDTIQSARFLGDKAFVVTFEQIDPLVAFDLSDPNNPVLRGQLEIPGFSSYIHPLGDDFLLTIGREGGENGQGTGNSFQLQIFDVSDLSNPTPLASATPNLGPEDYAFSTAEHDPLAFAFLNLNGSASAPQGLLSIPAQIGSRNASRSLSGFIAWRVSAGGGAASIDEYARVDHKDQRSGEGERCPGSREDLPPDGCSRFAPVIYNEPLRSAIIVESGLLRDSVSLLTVSSAKLIATDASGPTPVEQATLRFDP